MMRACAARRGAAHSCSQPRPPPTRARGRAAGAGGRPAITQQPFASPRPFFSATSAQPTRSKNCARARRAAIGRRWLAASSAKQATGSNLWCVQHQTRSNHNDCFMRHTGGRRSCGGAQFLEELRKIATQPTRQQINFNDSYVATVLNGGSTYYFLRGSELIEPDFLASIKQEP